MYLFQDTGKHYQKIASSTNMDYLCNLMLERIEEGTPPERLLISSNKNVNKNRLTKLDLDL